jgi:hypothetical protein
MPKGRRYTPEQIITKLREAEVLQSQGMGVEDAALATVVVHPSQIQQISLTL